MGKSQASCTGCQTDVPGTTAYSVGSDTASRGKRLACSCCEAGKSVFSLPLLCAPRGKRVLRQTWVAQTSLEGGHGQT